VIHRSVRDGAELTEADLVAAYEVADRARPHLRVNFVASLDGAVEVEGVSKALSTPDDSTVFSLLRMISDAVLVGAGTVRAENYRGLRLGSARQQWRREHGLPENPRLVLVSSRLALDPAMPALADAAVRPLVITHEGGPAERRSALGEVADVVEFGATAIDLPAAVEYLAAQGMPQILSEGGPHLLGALTEADLVDELCLSVAPLLAGPGAGRITAGLSGAGSPTRHLRLTSVLQSDDGTLLLRYLRPGPA
jgi:riboflavin biosynthesis pyrimidine reductase